MKAIKIGLAVIVVAAIAFFVIRAQVNPNKVKRVSLPKNQFTELIEKEIISLGKLPDSRFCKDAYNNIMFLIDDYYKPHPPQYPYGRLGNSQSENDQWKENLTKNLFAIYVDKFILQAFFEFNCSEWKIEDLNFIRSEYQTLRKSKLLDKGTPVDNKLAEIETIFRKYDEIVGFITTCKGFSYTAPTFNDHFPTADVQNKISRAATYETNHLENGYVNHCARLHDGLNEIPQALFRANVKYLENKINLWSNLYSNYNSQSDYANNLYKPLKSEIDALYNTTYNVANFESEYARLSNKWSADNAKAYTYNYSKRR